MSSIHLKGTPMSSIQLSPTALARARGQQAGQCVGEKVMQTDGTIVPVTPAFDPEAARERIRQELLAEMQAKPEPKQPKSGILTTVGTIALVRGDYQGKPTLGLYALDDKGKIKQARNGEQYAIKGQLHVISWWQEHAEAIRALLDAAKET